MKNVLTLVDDTSFEEAVELLDKNGNGFLPIIDEQGVLIGVITDGDLRRAILSNKRSITDVMNPNPITMPSGTPSYLVRNKLKEIHRRQMPLVDSDGRLRDVIVLNDFEVTSKSNWVVIMAGGLGSRLGDLTKDIPKPMLPVAGEPMLKRIIDSFIDHGFHKFILCVNYKADVIEEYFKDGSRFGIEIVYTREHKRMGTAGALSLIDFPISDDFFVINGDLITTLDYEDFLSYHVENKSDATMCVKDFNYDVPFACIESDRRKNLVAIKEKPKYSFQINAGIYLLNRKLIDLIPKDTFFDMPSLFESSISHNFNVKIFRMEDYWLDIGRPDDYTKGNLDFNV